MKKQICARCFWTTDRQLNIDGMKLDMTSGIKLFDW